MAGLAPALVPTLVALNPVVGSADIATDVMLVVDFGERVTEGSKLGVADVDVHVVLVVGGDVWLYEVVDVVAVVVGLGDVDDVVLPDPPPSIEWQNEATKDPAPFAIGEPVVDSRIGI